VHRAEKALHPFQTGKGGARASTEIEAYASTNGSLSLVWPACYDSIVFNFGKPKTAGDWIVHIAGAIVAVFLVWWMLRLYVL
jgi:hypothetical protein